MDMTGKIIKNMLTSKNPYEGVQISSTELLTIPSKSGNVIENHIDFDMLKIIY
jgi:hypothetical protein